MKTHNYLKDIVNICDHQHLSVEDIFYQLQKEHPQIAKASVYRNIEKLVEQKELHVLPGIKKAKLYEKSIDPHAHILNKETGEIQDIPLNIQNREIPIPG
ncbi:MAG: hypothetical protein GXP45_02555 [bacterium]|nr:hypothetical protein [bacterium]